MVRPVRMTKAVAERILGDVPEDKRFWVVDGRALKNLEELEGALRQMDEGTYRYHAADSNNDFSNWVRDVIGDDKLARDLNKRANPEQAAKAVAERVVWLRSRMQGY